MNVLLLVIDSLRAAALRPRDGVARPRTPFLDQLRRESVSFSRAYATECWTLPTHTSMFTGLLPSAHGAHFQTMGYEGTGPTIAEVLAAGGYHTEVVTRNFIFDGTLPGVTRGFQHNTRPLADSSRINPFAIFLALAKPRFRRHIRQTGFFHPFQKDNRRFLATFARALSPADTRALEYLLHRMLELRDKGRRYFLFCNLYDVHAPYPPSRRSILRSFWSPSGCLENLMFPKVMASLGTHRYLQPGFRLSGRGRRMLIDRYHRAIELMDEKLAEFYRAASARNLFDDTLVILTSDHGEAFGEHGLYLHDASVYDTHLHVPLWIHHPQRPPEEINDVVSTLDLFGLMQSAADPGGADTLADEGYRRQRPVARAEHFHYPHLPNAAPGYRQNRAAAIAGDTKVILHQGRTESYDLAADPDERNPMDGSLADFARDCQKAGFAGPALESALRELGCWQERQRGLEPKAA